jgi:hypothetical protein
MRGSSNTNQKSNSGLLTTLGRVSARLLLILIHRPRRQAEWRDLSGSGSAATVWRSQMHREEVQRSKPEAMRPDELRSEGTPSFSERAERWGTDLWFLWGVCQRDSLQERNRQPQHSKKRIFTQPDRAWSPVRAPSRAGSLLQKSKSGATKNPQTITHLRASCLSGYQKSSSRHTS